MANKECTKCIHNAVCKTAESCDGCVSGCKHFKEEKRGRWMREQILIGVEYSCSACGGCKHSIASYHSCMNYCPICGADMKGE